MPGIWEEMMHSLVSEHPIAVLGAYGGAARDAAIALDLIREEYRVPYLGEQQGGLDSAFKRLLELRSKIREDKRKVLKEFAVRSDTEALAKDLVQWLASQIGPDQSVA
jgi:hypothetical protein